MTKSKRINVQLDEHIADNIEQVAREKGTSTVDLMRQLIRVGIRMFKARDAGATLIVREKDGSEKGIILL